MIDCPLEDAVESYGLGRLSLVVFEQGEPPGEKTFQAFLEVFVVAATLVDNVAGKIIMEKTVKDMFHRDIFVAMGFGFFYGLDKG